jgi:hypothetical protein
MSVASTVGVWFATLLPDWAPPAELVNADDLISSVLDQGEGLGVLVPWSYVGLIAAIPLTLWVGGLLFKAARVALSHVPFFGGKG